MSNLKCPACCSSELVLENYADDLEYKGANLHVEGLSQYRCSACDYASETHSQHDDNIAKIKQAFFETKALCKKELNLLTGAEIRAIRKQLNLTQQEAAKLFGGGINAFSKYENEEIVQAVSIDRLIRMVATLGPGGLSVLKDVSEQSAPPSMKPSMSLRVGALGLGAAGHQLVFVTQNASTAYVSSSNLMRITARRAEKKANTAVAGNFSEIECIAGMYICNPVTGALISTSPGKGATDRPRGEKSLAR